MHRHPNCPPGSHGALALKWLERLLVIVGVGLLSSYALMMADARLAQWNARMALEMASPVFRQAPALASVPTIDTPEPSAIVVAGDAIAELSIPRVHLSAVVLHGSDSQTLRRGPGHLERTPLPGQPGNVVIAGHRDTFFRPLRDVLQGDDVFVTTPRERLHYRVTSLRVVNPRDLSVLEPTEQATLTLITCYPFWVFGDAPDRFVVRATRVVTGADPSAATAPPPPELVAAPPVGDRVSVRPPGGVPVILDDQSVVRQIVERYRLAYNAGLVRENPAASVLLKFDACDVGVTEGQATASCETSSESRNGQERQVRRFVFERAGEGWAIRSIVIEGG